MRAQALFRIMLTLCLTLFATRFSSPNFDSIKPFSTFVASEATQGVAADSSFIYAIGNDVVGKYDRKTFAKVESYKSGTDDPLKHMNGGVVVGNKLYCSHSNYPETPMSSSIEIFDTASLKHIGSQSFGIDTGSLVWVDWYQGNWWVCFGHYNGKGGEPGMKNDRTVLVKFDKDWRRIGGYSFPKEIVERWDGMTCSGGVFGPDGLIYATGHHAPEIHVLKLPKSGSALEFVKVIPSPVEGQGIAIDTKTKTIFQMQRKEKAIYLFDMNLF